LGLRGAQAQLDNPQSRPMVPELSSTDAQRHLRDPESVTHQWLIERTRSRLFQKRRPFCDSRCGLLTTGATASRIRVRNQRRTTSPVTGFCDRRAHETAARLRPRLHRRPATAPAGSTTSSEPAGPRCSSRPPAAPAPTVRCTACALGWRPAPPAWPAAHQFLDLAARQALARTCPMMGCEGAGGRGVCGKLAGRSQPSATRT
jgi:hypothetical protein